MARMPRWIGISLLSFVAFGCVPLEKYNAARLDSEQYAQRLAAAEREKGELQAQSAAYKQQLDAVMMNGGSKDALVVNQANQITELQHQVDELNRRYEGAMNRVGQAVALDPVLNNALTQFAAQNPDLVEFDSTRGVVKFKSDVTFNTGSAELASSAKGAIDRFASILNSPAAMAYEFMVVGHTDDTKVQHQATIAAGHKDNWYLSAHRAISVGEELMHSGTSASRMEVAGFADQRPVASNATAAGKQQNRRVEVLILPTTVRSTSPGVANISAPRRSSPKPEMNKDATVETDRRPILNK
ncbi:MAG TPA: OmpA family protein [Humisphaera sp.]|nr:OmpA family protein [Humisphaera sp.]